MKTLETERLILRPWRPEDIDDFFEYARDPEVGPNAGWPPHKDKGMSLNILQSFMEKQEVWAIEFKHNNKAVGSVGAHADEKRRGVNGRMIGYVLARKYWGMGLMTEAVNEMIRYLFEEEKYDIVSCYHYPFNTRSKRVIEKCGFRYEGTLRQASRILDGKIYDDVCYSIIRDEYFAAKV